MTFEQEMDLRLVIQGSGLFIKKRHREAIHALLQLAHKHMDEASLAQHRITKADEVFSKERTDWETRLRNANIENNELKQSIIDTNDTCKKLRTYNQEIKDDIIKYQNEVSDLAHKLGCLSEEYHKTQEAALKLQEDYDVAAMRAVTAEGQLAEAQEQERCLRMTEEALGKELHEVSINFVSLQGKMDEAIESMKPLIQQKIEEAVEEAFKTLRTN